MMTLRLFFNHLRNEKNLKISTTFTFYELHIYFVPLWKALFIYLLIVVVYWIKYCQTVFKKNKIQKLVFWRWGGGFLQILGVPMK